MRSLLLRLTLTVVIATVLCVAYGCSAALAQAKEAVTAPVPRRDPVLAPIPREHLHGHWVMSENGHADFCWGPSLWLGGFPNGEPKHYATDCERGGALVPLHD